MIDHSNSFAPWRSRLRSRDGVAYVDVVRGLTPRYGVVWAQLAAGYAALAAAAAAEVWLQRTWPGTMGVALLAFGFVFGYGINVISQFIHEAVHYNLAPNRTTNDRLANLAIGVLLGHDVASTRQLHLQHHRKLGSVEDLESSYFDPLNVRFIVESLLGVRTMRIMHLRRSWLAAADGIAMQPSRAMLVAGAGFHAAVVGAGYAVGWWVSVSWVIGALSVFPFLAALRTILEHRDDEADAGTDYRLTAHGAFTRLFGDGPVSSTFGAAGFNRHLLHHWEPQLSYTRLADLERYVLTTELAPVLHHRAARYPAVFFSMLIGRRHRGPARRSA